MFVQYHLKNLFQRSKKIQINPRNYKLYSFLSPYSEIPISKNNFHKIPEILTFNWEVNINYEYLFKNIKEVNDLFLKEKLSNYDLFRVNLLFEDKEFETISFFEQLCDSEKENYRQSGYKITNEVSIVFLIDKKKNNVEERASISMIFDIPSENYQ